MIAGPTSLANNEPSLEFKQLLRSLSSQATNLVKTYEKIMAMGLEEGFSEKEIKEMVKSELKDIKTRHQLRYLFDPESAKQASKKQYEEMRNIAQNDNKKETEQSSTSTDYDIKISNKAKIIDVQTEDVDIKNMENKNTEKDVKEVALTHEFEAHQNTMKAITNAGFDIDKGISIIKGNPAQVLYQLEAYKQQDIREMIILVQKVS